MIPTVERETVAISELKPAKYNPRSITPAAMEALSSSLDRFGLVQEIVVNRRNMTVVGGHMRLRALKRKRIKEVPVAFVDLDETDEKTLNIALNSPTLEGKFTDGLDALLSEIRVKDEDVFADFHFSDLFADKKKKDKDEDTGEQLGDLKYRIIIECQDESEQASLLDRFVEEGINARGMMV